MRFIYTYGNIAVDTIEEAIELRQKFGSDFELQRVEADPLTGIGIHAYMNTPYEPKLNREVTSR